MSKSIPDGWMDYKPCGRVIDGTRIICFKVPLHARVQTGKPDTSINEIWDLNNLQATIPKLGAVIDLTNTSRYYDPKELAALGVHHKKIMMPGRIIPPENKVQEFMDAVDDFLGINCDLLVGVHCTHGLNRTGYMVCRYMRDRLQMPAAVAIKKFEKARGYQIIRENYVAHLLGKKPPPPDPFDNHSDKKPRERNHSTDYGNRRCGSNEVINWRDECKYPRNNANNSRRSSGSKSRKESSGQERSDSDFDFRFDY